MSQLRILIIFSLAIFMIIPHGESKRVGCASFGHSCYGGFGRKRSDPTLTLDISQDNEASQNQQQAGPLMKMFPQTNPQLAHSETQQQQLFEQEKEFKMIVLSTMNQVVEETLKRIAGEFEK